MRRLNGTGSVVAFLILLSAAAAPAVPPVKTRPVSACIVNARGKVIHDDRDHVGDLRVTFADGHREQWTHGAHCLLAKVSRNGLVGWTSAAEQNWAWDHPWMNELLLLSRDGQMIRELEAPNRFIEEWDFTDRGASVVMRSRMLHGPSDIEKFDVATGYLIAARSGIGQGPMPDWARRHADPK
jgi:hypothetical protein